MKNTTSVGKTSDSTTSKKRRISNKAVFSLIFYVIMPIFSISIIMATYPELSRERLLGILYRTIPIGFVLIAVAQFQVRYKKGELGRLVSNELYVLLVVAWLFALLGGEPVIHQTWEEYSFSLHIWNYVILILVVTGMNILYYILEYQAYNEKGVLTEDESIAQDQKEVVKEPKGVTIITVVTDP